MLVLAVDTSLQRCSVAVVYEGAPLSIQSEDREKGHAERIAPMTQAAFAQAGVAPGDLDRIGVVVGPGGFTGVRIALSFARAMGLAAGVGVVGVTSLAALAGSVEADGDIASVIDARRGQVYAGLYSRGKEMLSPFVADPDEAAQRLAEAAGGPVALVGSGAALLPGNASWTMAGADPQIDPLIVARLAAKAPPPDGPPAPLYLRPPDAKPPASRPISK